MHNCVTGLTQLGCISLPAISHWQCRACQAEEAVSGWATFSTTRGGFYGVWQLVQIGHRQAAPLPLSTSLCRLGLSLLKGEQRREQREDLIVFVWRGNVLLAVLTGCSVTVIAQVYAKGVQEVGWLIKTYTCSTSVPPDHQLLNIPSCSCEKCASMCHVP